MLRPSLWSALLTAAFFSAGCPSEPSPAPAPAPAPAAPAAPAATPVVLEERELPVKCGCKIESVKKCSEWAEVDGEWVKMTGHNLGSMPFCGKENVRARVSGELSEGTLRLTSITVLPPPG
jgi:hypothetical protein